MDVGQDQQWPVPLEKLAPAGMEGEGFTRATWKKADKKTLDEGLEAYKYVHSK